MTLKMKWPKSSTLMYMTSLMRVSGEMSGLSRLTAMIRGINWGIWSLMNSKKLNKSDSSGVLVNPDPTAIIKQSKDPELTCGGSETFVNFKL